MKTLYYYEVSVSKNGGTDGGVKGLFRQGDKVHWVRKGTPRDSFAETQADAIANGERPYRIKSERINNPTYGEPVVTDTIAVNVAAAE